jgi:hypothetical protein
MRPAMLTADILSDGLAALLSSRLRRHVGQLGQSTGRGPHKLSVLPSQLPVLCHAVPQLRALNACLRVLSDSDTPVSLFPAQLRRLNLHIFNAPFVSNDRAVALLASIGQLPQLHTLRLELRHGEVSVASLQRLPLLRELHLSVSFRNAAQFAADLRALPWLQRLRFEMSRHSPTHAQRCALFTALLRDAPEEELRALQWRDFTIVGLHLTDELTPLLLRLPLLERLEANLSRCTRFDFFPSLSHLTHVELDLYGLPKGPWWRLLSVLTSDGMARMQSQELRNVECSDDDLTNLLSHTPSLSSLSLTLDELSAVTALSFFHALASVSPTLTHLTLKCLYAWRLNSADLPLLFGLPHLRVLRLLDWDPDTLTTDHEQFAPFQRRPCVVLPQLEVFEWTVHSQ